MSVVLLVSATEADTARLVENGPRRDFLELAAALDARVAYLDGAKKPSGWRGKLAGPHVRHAWRAARAAESGDTLFADGEHIGLPLVLALALLRRRNAVVVLGHYVSKPWKRRLIRAASLLRRNVTMVTHSVVQQRAALRASGGRWAIELLPYQVDTAFWRREAVEAAESSGQPPARPLVVAAGSEHRDYATLIEALRGLPVDAVIAAGSHWARDLAAADDAPPNVTVFTEPLTFAALRKRYVAATVVVMPLENVPNQSGITGMLESMAMGTPLIVTASTGQRECVRGPLVRAAGIDPEPMAARGPQLFSARETPAPNGLYVAPGDAAGLRTAIEAVCADADLRATLAANGRATAERVFSLETFTRDLAAIVRAAGAPREAADGDGA